MTMDNLLFPVEQKPDPNKHLWDQFIKLGEMIGDGAHEEPGGKWMSREYKKLSKILVPEIKEAETNFRQIKNKAIDEKIKLLLEKMKSTCCNSDFKQARSGSLIVYCFLCNKRYKATTSKK